MPTAHGQSVSFLIRRFREAGVRLQHRHGQNFLIDLNLQRLIVERAQLGPQDVVVEVGTGTGSLTAMTAERAAAVVTVEIDPQLYALARDELSGVPNVTLLSQDALKNKNHLHPALLDAIAEALAAHPGSRLKLVANLPFSVATPVLSNFLTAPIVPVSMTATIQRELAERITATSGTKDYGALSIWMQAQCQVEIVRLLPPTVFWPQPKVTSAIVHIEVDPERRDRIGDLLFFHTFVRSMFFHRRKFLRRQLQSAVGKEVEAAAVDRLLAEQHLDPQSRAEQLTVEQMIELSRAAQQLMAGAH